MAWHWEQFVVQYPDWMTLLIPELHLARVWKYVRGYFWPLWKNLNCQLNANLLKVLFWSSMSSSIAYMTHSEKRMGDRAELHDWKLTIQGGVNSPNYSSNLNLSAAWRHSFTTKHYIQRSITIITRQFCFFFSSKNHIDLTNKLLVYDCTVNIEDNSQVAVR